MKGWSTMKLGASVRIRAGVALCLLVLNMSLPTNWWIPTANATPIVPALSTMAIGFEAEDDPIFGWNGGPFIINRGTPRLDHMVESMDDLWQKLFDEPFTFDNWQAMLLTPIKDGFAVATLPSGEVFQIQALSLTDISEEVLAGLPPDMVDDYPCDVVAQSFIGEVSTGLATIPVNGVLMQQPLCLGNTFTVVSTVDADTYEVLSGNYVPDEVHGFSEYIDTDKTPPVICPGLDQCYLDCEAAHQAALAALAAVQAQADGARATYDNAMMACETTWRNARSVAFDTRNQLLDAAETAHANAVQAANTAYNNAVNRANATYAQAVAGCVLPGCYLGPWLVLQAKLDIAKLLHQAMLAIARTDLVAAKVAAHIVFNQLINAANSAYAACKAAAQAAYDAALCVLYQGLTPATRAALNNLKACLDACYDNFSPGCAGALPPEDYPEYWWVIPINNDCPVVGGG